MHGSDLAGTMAISRRDVYVFDRRETRPTKESDMAWELVPETRSLAPAAFADWDILRTDASGVVTPEMAEMIQQRIAVLFGGKSGGSESRSEDVRSCTETV